MPSNTPTPQDRATAEKFDELCLLAMQLREDFTNALATRPVSARALSDAEVRDLFSQLWTSLGEWTGRIARPDADMAPTTAFVDLVKRIERLALGASSSPDADALTAAKREALTEWADALAALASTVNANPIMAALAVREYRDRTYPIAPPSVVLSNGDTVRFIAATRVWWRDMQRGASCASGIGGAWDSILRDTDTIGDRKKVEALAATLSPTGAER